MSKRILGLLTCLLFVALAYAGDVWKAKPYKQWEEKDVRKILMDSPWVKTAHVDANWRKPGGGGDVAAQPPQGGSAPAPSGGGGGGMYGGPGGGGPGGYGAGSGNAGGMGGPQISEADFLIRWSSAKTMREAVARSYVLRGSMKEDDADKALAEEPAEYQVSVSGQDMTPFLKVEEKDLQAKTYLMLKKEKIKLAPVRVVIQRKQGAKPDDPQSILAVVFLFAKKDASGQPAIGAQEKNLEFVCESGLATLRTSFDLQKMAGAQGPDW